VRGSWGGGLSRLAQVTTGDSDMACIGKDDGTRTAVAQRDRPTYQYCIERASLRILIL